MIRQTGYFWHVHHDEIVDYCYSYDERRAYILSNKPAEERELRLRLMQPVQDVKDVERARKAYEKATGIAWKAFDKAIAPLWKAYKEAESKARKTFEKDLMLETYEKAIAPKKMVFDEAQDLAWEVYNKAKDQSQKIYEEIVLPIHARECPDCTWNGKIIFEKGE